MTTDAKILSTYLSATDEQKAASQTLRQMDTVRDKMLSAGAGPGATAVALVQYAGTVAEVARRDPETRERVARDLPATRPQQIEREAPRPLAGETTGAVVVAADIAARHGAKASDRDALADELQLRLAEVAAGQRAAAEFAARATPSDHARGEQLAQRPERTGKERD